MRLFVALPLAATVAGPLDDALIAFRAAAPELRWIEAARWHLTLKFIGPGDPTLVDRLTAALDAVAATHRPFSLQLAALGVFPNFRRAHVVCIGVAPEARLELLQHDLEVACAARVGAELSGRPFRPHVTLARVPAPLPLDRARALARAARRVAFSATQEVAALSLFDSAGDRSGATYHRLHTACFGGR